MSILSNFGQRVRELRLKSGMSQEALAARAGLDRSYIGGVERGERNVSLENIAKLTEALDVDMSYFFDNERFELHSAYMKSEFRKALSERFVYNIDFEEEVISWQVKGVLSAEDIVKTSFDLKIACTYLSKGRIKLLIDNRGMMADGHPFVFTPEANEKIEELQKWMLPHCQKVAVLCNSKLMKNQLDRLSQRTGMNGISRHFYEENEAELLAQAYSFLEIPHNRLISG
ncbi:helix-turn-helix domain-containing protein [Paenibacillus doosanensis]|uniref:Anaerobic benzoate catabolism transcriptional regulator n=1 Tax=Paenibacillus konkukensis TaxID=2020716 RepID=A0ABY4RX37_9BACL|nr:MULTISPECIES: helix-turn-helix transcriptional regulator [Paenibacillus]MCS7460785.1 helix-turn-helix domain-containing protein [Paenibacillus doosanensis]UQZ85964.1 anaerobic benzoate catabolism transcriptional regulator [Paenibacillus konkukensis]